MSRAREESLLGRGPVLWVVGGLTLSVFPLVAALPLWVPIAFVAAGAWRIWIEFSGGNMPNGYVRFFFFAIGLGGVMISNSGHVDSQAAVAFLVTLTALKFLELRTARDFVLIALLGYFLLLSGFFFLESLASSLYSIFVIGILTTGIVRLTMGVPQDGLRWDEIRVGLTMLLQAAPVALVLFLLFPRMQGRFQFPFFNRETGQTGMRDEISPGDFASLANVRDEAFRVDFPGGEVPELSSLYWRGAVLWQGDGLRWSRGSPRPSTSTFSRKRESKTLWQNITISPHRMKWMFALDHPITVIGGTLEAGGVVESKTTIRQKMRYSALSELGNRHERFAPEAMRKAVLVPKRTLTPKLTELVEKLKSGEADVQTIVRRGLDYFRSNGFQYTLSPGTYRPDGLDDFLFDRRKGFCEHYAAAFATLMRCAGVPAVVVVGYHGGERNNVGNFLTVRQSDAHAWCEIFSGDLGWVRVDPTVVVAPERVTFGMDPFIQLGDTTSAGERLERISEATQPEGLAGLLRELRYSWDALSYQWDLMVLSYDGEVQEMLYKIVGLTPGSGSIWIAMLGISGVVLALMGWLMRRPPRTGRERLALLYEQFCRQLAQAGVSRECWEGPLAYGERAAGAIPQAGVVIRSLVQCYVQARYGKNAPTAESAREMAGRLRELKRAL